MKEGMEYLSYDEISLILFRNIFTSLLGVTFTWKFRDYENLESSFDESFRWARLLLSSSTLFILEAFNKKSENLVEPITDINDIH